MTEEEIRKMEEIIANAEREAAFARLRFSMKRLEKAKEAAQRRKDKDKEKEQKKE